MKNRKRNVVIMPNSKKEAEKLVKDWDKHTRREKRFIVQNGKKVAIIASVLTLVCCSACTSFGASQMFADSDEGMVMIAGNAEGIRAYNDGISGVISNTKASKDVKSAYWENRNEETEVRKFKQLRLFRPAPAAAKKATTNRGQ